MAESRVSAMYARQSGLGTQTRDNKTIWACSIAPGSSLHACNVQALERGEACAHCMRLHLYHHPSASLLTLRGLILNFATSEPEIRHLGLEKG